MNDGAIVLKTFVDNTGVAEGIGTLKSGLSSITGIVGKLGIAMGIAFGVKQMIQFGKEAATVASNLEEVQNVVDVSFGSMAGEMNNFAETAIETFGMSELTAKKAGSSFMAMAKGMKMDSEQAKNMAISLTGLTGDMASFYNISQDEAKTALSSVFTGETETLKRYGILITEVNLQEFARQEGITKSISEMTQQEKVMLRYNYVMQATNLAQGDFIRTQDSWANQTRILSENWTQLKGEIGKTVITVGSLLLPLLNSAISGLTKIAELSQIIAKSVYKMFTGKELNVEQSISEASAINEAVSNQEDLTDATKETAKEQAKSLANFDEINKLSDNSYSSSDNSSGGMGNLGVPPSKGDEKTDYSKLTSEIETMCGKIMAILGGALCAIGVILLLTGHIGWGIGFIIAGAATLLVTEAMVMNNDPTGQIASTMTTIMGILAGALCAIGIILITLGSTALGIGFIVAGAFTLGAAAVNIAMFSTDKIESTLNLITGIAGGAMLALGVMLAVFTGANPLSIGLIVAGASLLAMTLARIMINSMSDTVKTVINVITGIASVSMLALGVILVCTGFIPLGIALIVAGAVSLAPTVYANKDAILTWIRDTLEEVAGVFSYYADYIEDVFSGLWYDIKCGALNMVNYVIKVINKMVEGILLPFNVIIDGLNHIPGTKIPRLSWSIPTISLPEPPRLAKGAVIPANKEFLAVLGDQKHGTNIEAPLETIEQAVANVLGTQQVNVNFTGSVAQLVRLLQPEIDVQRKKASVFG